MRLVELETGDGPTPPRRPDERAARRGRSSVRSPASRRCWPPCSGGRHARLRRSLKDVAARVPETQVLMIMGTDGIPIEQLVLRADPNIEAVAAEYTTLCGPASPAARTRGSARCASWRS